MRLGNLPFKTPPLHTGASFCNQPIVGEGLCALPQRAAMADFEKMYYELFNGITDLIEELKDLRQKAEEAT